MNIFEFLDYRSFLREYIKQLPKRGHGEINKMAKAAAIHPSLLSQILSGEKNLSLEQAQRIAVYIDLTIQEMDYLLNLVQFQRSGTHELKSFFRQKLNLLKLASTELSQQVRQDQQLTEEEKSILYSHWLYLAVWLFTSIGDGKALEDVGVQFGITRERAVEILNFLVATKLCVLDRGRYQMGSQSIHVGRGSPHLHKHHTNWRIRAIEASDKIDLDELMYSAPISVSKSDFAKIKDRLTEVIKEATDLALASSAEEVVYFGLDFFRIKK
jgi:uncharacterized protein (TIGR02147 family)